jgi:hypothetical protein
MALGRASLTRKVMHSVSRGRPQFRQMASESFETESEVTPGKKGPTAIVFLNMGGPSKTSEVGDFLSRLFVRCAECRLADSTDIDSSPMPT